ncbi:MAG: ADP-ribosylglycohydrolase family protein [Myxococcales bacterium]|nr:ADP-ribosylglycohydrolase family protein [Myxococcales bacterium]
MTTPLELALLALDGLSLGDCFGERFFGPTDEVIPRLEQRVVPDAPWPYTDDTEMALSVVEVLIKFGRIDQDELALRFARRMNYARGYGVGAYEILTEISAGESWRSASRNGFNGMGSFGNGAAMRVAPLGAFFAERPRATLVEEAARSAEVTHAHPEGIAGAIAVAVAVASAYRRRQSALGQPWLKTVIDAVPAGYTRDAIVEALAVPSTADIVTAAKALGNGSGVTAPDTVPLCLWVAAYATDFSEAMWTTVGALGDRDTTCAIVGGILAPRLGRAALPPRWLNARETFVLDAG